VVETKIRSDTRGDGGERHPAADAGQAECSAAHLTVPDRRASVLLLVSQILVVAFCLWVLWTCGSR